MKIFISGGCKNGKSTIAERIAVSLYETRKADPLYYLATMLPSDNEDNERIDRHRFLRRDSGFTTIEQPNNIHHVVKNCENGGVFLLDSATALLANEMFLRDGSIVLDADKKVAEDIKTLLHSLDNIVIVSDYIYSDAAIYDELTNSYRKGLAFVDRTCAQLCDVVIEVTYSAVIFHKGHFGEKNEAII